MAKTAGTHHRAMSSRKPRAMTKKMPSVATPMAAAPMMPGSGAPADAAGPPLPAILPK
jgi:hypothetical protein